MKLADMATQARGGAPADRATRPSSKQAGERADVEAGMAKLFASETAFELATESLRIHGGVGYTTELPVERYYRDAPLMIIGEGTNEIQRLVIARGLLRARRRAPMIRRLPAAVAIVAIGAFVFFGCGGDDSDGGATTTTRRPPARGRLHRRLRDVDSQSANEASARRPNKPTVSRVGSSARSVPTASRMRASPRPGSNATPQPKTELTAEEADSITSAFFDCYDVTGTYVAARRRRNPHRDAAHLCWRSRRRCGRICLASCREGSDAQLTEAEAEGFVDTLLSVRPAR